MSDQIVDNVVSISGLLSQKADDDFYAESERIFITIKDSGPYLKPEPLLKSAWPNPARSFYLSLSARLNEAAEHSTDIASQRLLLWLSIRLGEGFEFAQNSPFPKKIIRSFIEGKEILKPETAKNVLSRSLNALVTAGTNPLSKLARLKGLARTPCPQAGHEFYASVIEDLKNAVDRADLRNADEFHRLLWIAHRLGASPKLISQEQLIPVRTVKGWISAQNETPTDQQRRPVLLSALHSLSNPTAPKPG
ncbi:MAG TPA: hypothetical protein VFR09_07535 [Alphaproteobacteria bacterium]|nr:hypothetical protein [Alphaproteobacteria bacterium]